MSTSSEKLKSSYDQQLEALARTLDTQIHDESTLRDIHTAFSMLLAGNGNAESSIRSVLQRQFASGQLRSETYQLVQQMLNRLVSEHVETLPGEPQDTESRDPFGDTTIIPGDSFVPVTPEDSLQVGSVLRDRFLLQEKVAGGSMGDVYKALDRRLAETGTENPYVAIKVLAPKLSRNGNALRALQQEAAKGRFLSHPNIVRFIDLDRDDDLYFIVMEWLDGRTLADILDDARHNKIDTATALDIVRQVGQALDYAHRCGVVHADVKPGNIMITASGQAMLFDFGVARVRQKQSSGPAEFDPGVLAVGTPIYSSMQVLTGEDPVPADDVFSLGCLLYRLLAGYRVFGPRNAAEAAETGMEPQRLQGISQPQWAALRKSLAYSRVTRFASVAEFLRALEGKSPSAEETQSLPELDESDGTHFPWRIVTAIALLAAAGVTGIVLKANGVFDQFAATAPVESPAVAPETLAPVPVQDDRDRTGHSTPVAAVEIPAAVEAIEESGEAESIPGDSPPSETGEVDTATPVDFSQLPLPDLVVEIGPADGKPFEGQITLTEDAKPGIVDFLRSTDISFPRTLRLEETRYSGNRSPWESGRYALQDNGLVRFESGESRVRTTITMTSNPLREPDRDAVLELRDAEFPGMALATVSVSLLDDDQRRFEAGLAANTVAFAVSQVSVRENDPAVQIDVLRFNPDGTDLDVNYVVRDVTATEGQDYISPATGTVSFGPGQRTARIFIPLVQDTLSESDEAFMLELESPRPNEDTNIFLRIAVMIRDDDS